MDPRQTTDPRFARLADDLQDRLIDRRTFLVRAAWNG